MSWQSLVPRVLEALHANVETIRGMDIAPDTQLLSTGLLDSFGIVNLIPALESAFGTSIDLDDVEVSMFESAESIAQLLHSSCGEA